MRYFIPSIISFYFRRPLFGKHAAKTKKLNDDEGENLLSSELADILCASSSAYLHRIAGEKIKTPYYCLATWTKIAHETNSRSMAFGILMRRMGKLSGVSDFIFSMTGKTLWLELKDGEERPLSQDQLFFRDWVAVTGDYYEVAYTLDQAVNILLKHSILTKNV